MSLVQFRKIASEQSRSVLDTASLDTDDIQRYDAKDAVVTVNVGGKSWITLRSTLQQSPTLKRNLALVEANENLCKDGAIFVDRNPEHFEFILAHLRNKADAVSVTKCIPCHVKNGRADVSMYTVQLPEDQKKLRDIWLEAHYFGLHDLEKRVCMAFKYRLILAFAGEGGNPFDKAMAIVTHIRRFIVAAFGSLACLMSMSSSSDQEQAQVDMYSRLASAVPKLADVVPKLAAVSATVA